MTSSTKIWIAGASGFCGRALVDLLAQQKKFIVIPHIRPSSSRANQLIPYWRKLGLEPVVCEWHLLEEQWFNHRPQVVISCLGTTKRKAKKGGGSYQEVDLEMNQTLIRYAEELQLDQQKYNEVRPRHMVYISSMGSEWGRWNAYLRPRLLVEQSLQASTLHYSIIKPGILHGESRDETRIGETVGAHFSQILATFFAFCGFKKLSYHVKPLDAPELAQFLVLLIGEIVEGQTRKGVQYPITEIHSTLAELTKTSHNQQLDG